jgi:Cu+-exporting ATPase
MEVTIRVYGMTCGHCQRRIADAIFSLDEVTTT